MATLRKEIKRSPYIAESAAFYREHEWGSACESEVEPLLDRLDYWLEALENAEGWTPPLEDGDVAGFPPCHYCTKVRGRGQPRMPPRHPPR